MELSLVGSPNWNDSTCLDVFPDRPMFAFASRSYVVLMTFSGDSLRQLSCQPHQIFIAHHDRVCGLACLPTNISHRQQSNNLEPDLVTCGEDGFVKVWNCQHETLFSKLNLSDLNIKGKLSCIVVENRPSTCRNWRICTATESGTMLFWESKSGRNNTAHFKLEKEGIMHLSWKPCADYSDTLQLAVAYKRGLIAVYSVTFANSKISLVQSMRLKAHENDVVNVFWCPLNRENDFAGDLLTSSKDKGISLWSVESKSKICSEKFHCDHQSVWVSACWLPDGQIVVSNYRGELGFWDSNVKGGRAIKYFAKCNQINGHSRIVYSMRHAYYSFMSGASSTPGNFLISISMDRQVITWNLDGSPPRPLTSLPTIGGAVYSLACSSLSPSLIGIGTGDSCIRLYRPTDTSSRSQISAIWNNINGRVTAMAWHPFIEGLLAYATFDGRVGVVNIHGKKQGRLSNSHHSKRVYRLAWGPELIGTDEADNNNGLDSADDNTMWLYSIGKGPSGSPQLFCHDSKSHSDFKAEDISSKLFKYIGQLSGRSNNEPSIITFIFGKERSLSFDIAAIGHADGSIDIICCRPLVLICSISIYKKIINDLAWNPQNLWLACGSNIPSIGIVDLHTVIEKFSEDYASSGALLRQSWSPVVVGEFFAILDGHANRITCLDWNVHNPCQLVSGSLDSVTAVWDVKSGELIASFEGHTGRIYCCLWSRKDPDLIACGGDSNNLLFWRPSQQPKILPSKVKKMRPPDNECSALSNGEFSALDDPLTDTSTPQGSAVSLKEIEEVKLLAAKRIAELKLNDGSGDDTTLNVKSEHESVVSSKLDDAIDKTKASSKKKNAKRRRPGFLAKSINSLDISSASQEKALFELINFKINPTNSSLPPYLAHFGCRKHLLSHLDEELAYQLEKSHLENYFQLLFWAGRIGIAKRQASILHYMPDWLMSMFCLASTGGQIDAEIVDERVRLVIEETDDIVQAATYYLACHRVKSAIDLLKSKKAYLEALVISTLRLSPDDPIKYELIKLLAEKSSSNGNYSLATRCYVAMGNYKEAARWIEIRPTAQNYWISARMFALFDDKTTSRGYILKLVNECFSQGQYDVQKWADTFKSSDLDLREYILLMEIYLSVINREESLSLMNLFSSFMQEFSVSGEEISSLVNELVSNDISRQQSNQWKHAFIYLICDLFICLYHCLQSKNDSARLLKSLQLCASIDPIGASAIANSLLMSDCNISARSAVPDSFIQLYETIQNFLNDLKSCDENQISDSEPVDSNSNSETES